MPAPLLPLLFGIGGHAVGAYAQQKAKLATQIGSVTQRETDAALQALKTAVASGDLEQVQIQGSFLKGRGFSKEFLERATESAKLQTTSAKFKRAGVKLSGAPQDVPELAGPTPTGAGLRRNVPQRAVLPQQTPAPTAVSRQPVATQRVTPQQSIALRSAFGFDAGKFLNATADDQTDAFWYRDYDTCRDSGGEHSVCARDLAAKYGHVPDGVTNFEPDVEARIADFYKRILTKMTDPERARKYTLPNGQVDQNGLSTDSFISVLQESGFVPPHMADLRDKIIGLAQPKILPETGQALELPGAQAGLIATPGEIAAAIKQVEEQRITRAQKTAEAEGLGVEEAKKQTFLGELSRSIVKIQQEIEAKADKELEVQLEQLPEKIKIRKAEIKSEVEASKTAQFEVALDQPVDFNIATAMGLPPGTTNRQLYSMDVIPLGDDSQETYINIALRLIDVMKPIASRLFTKDGFARFTRGGQLAAQRFAQSNPDLATWESMKMSLAFALARAAGEKGPLREIDTRPYLKNAPDIFSSKLFANSFFDTYRRFLESTRESLRVKYVPSKKAVQAAVQPLTVAPLEGAKKTLVDLLIQAGYTPEQIAEDIDAMSE